MAKQRFSEQVSFLQAQFEEDNGTRMIRNVAFLGAVSQHGYTYKQEAMQKGANLYNGVRCFINHPSKEEEQTGRRDLMKLAGVTSNPRYEDGKIKGDVKLLSDQYGQKFWDIAHTMPTAASCSHVADGSMIEEGGEKFVDEISEVISVDLVVQGATTSNVFESAERKNDMDYSKITIEELRKLRPDLTNGLIKEGKATRDDEVKKLTEEKTALAETVDEYKIKEGQAKKKAEVERLLSESKLPKDAKTDVFRNQLLALESEDFEKNAKALIEDRISLVGGVKGMPANEDTGSGGKKMSEAMSSSLVEMGIE
jgi:hypothetical protein